MDNQEELQQCLKRLTNALEEDDEEQVLRLSEQYLFHNPDPEIYKCKLMALMKLGKYDEASKLKQTNKVTLNPEEDKFLSGYLFYRKGDYKKSTEGITSSQSLRARYLKAQSLYKQSNFSEASEAFGSLIVNDRASIGDNFEDACTNFFASLSMLLWTASPNYQAKPVIQQGLQIALDYCLQSSENITLREVYLNCCVLLAVYAKRECFQLDIPNEKGLRKQVFREFYDRLYQSEQNEMEVEEEVGELDERQKDKIVARLLETLFQEREKNVKLAENEVQQMENSLTRMGNKDLFLKVALVDFLIYMKCQGDTSQLHLLTREIEILQDLVSKDKSLGDKLQRILQENLTYNKVITLLHRHRFKEAKDSSESLRQRSDSLVIHSFLAVKLKNMKEFERISEKYENQNGQNAKILRQLCQLSVFNALNNQQKYSEIFRNFMDEFFVPQLKLSEEQRFLPAASFQVFSNAVIQHIFRNQGLMNEMEDLIQNLIMGFEDAQLLHKIAESFAKRNQMTQALSIYKKIIELNAEDELANRKVQYYRAFNEPETLNIEDLPPLDLISDYNKLRSLDVDFMSYKSTSTKPQSAKMSQTSKLVKKKKPVRKIRWPKNFNFDQPGPPVDPERWIPMIERRKYRKKAQQKGLMTRTQGTSNVDTKAQTQNFKTGASTSNKQTVSSGQVGKKGKKGKK